MSKFGLCVPLVSYNPLLTTGVFERRSENCFSFFGFEVPTVVFCIVGHCTLDAA
jgi:hypothetical protein